MQYSRISTLSFLQVAFRSVSDSHFPDDSTFHIFSHFFTHFFMHIFTGLPVISFLCRKSFECFLLTWTRVWMFSHLNWRGTCCGRVCWQVRPSLGRALPPENIPMSVFSRYFWFRSFYRTVFQYFSYSFFIVIDFVKSSPAAQNVSPVHCSHSGKGRFRCRVNTQFLSFVIWLYNLPFLSLSSYHYNNSHYQ